jgi:predicted RND superfamily exporter protein
VNWVMLGRELQGLMPGEIVRISLGLIVLILVILAFGLKSLRALALFLVVTLLVLACLAGAMSLFGMSCGFFNLAAVLLLLGTGTDYSILLLLALRRNGGNVPLARRELGLVIFLCSASAAAGFGSLAWAGNPGLADLGKTCALGLAIDAMISYFLLPRAWSLIFPLGTTGHSSLAD